jgi:hypothetical protein
MYEFGLLSVHKSLEILLLLLFFGEKINNGNKIIGE